jgi:A/G-specific adenine glycosylase
MLQQTTVTAVVPYFERFLNRFPDVLRLAAADEDEVLRLWEGLGYYSRARNIHRTARWIASERNGKFPESPPELERLPGIGRYTAGAIVSFAFDRPAPIVEANTLRLYCRLLGFGGNPRTSEGQRLLWSFAESLVPKRSPGTFNQALMELGATVCRPENPNCDRCPVSRWCVAFSAGEQSRIPRLAERPTVTAVTEIAVAIERSGRYLMLRRPAGERWGGLWDFVRFAATESNAKSDRSLARRLLRARTPAPLANSVGDMSELALSNRIGELSGVRAELGELLAVVRHSVTRYRITLHCYRARWTGGNPSQPAGEYQWVTPGELTELPLSVTGRKFARLLGGTEPA